MSWCIFSARLSVWVSVRRAALSLHSIPQSESSKQAVEPAFLKLNRHPVTRVHLTRGCERMCQPPTHPFTHTGTQYCTQSTLFYIHKFVHLTPERLKVGSNLLKFLRRYNFTHACDRYSTRHFRIKTAVSLLLFLLERMWLKLDSFIVSQLSFSAI